MPGDINEPLKKQAMPAAGPQVGGAPMYPQWGSANEATQPNPTMGEHMAGLLNPQMGQVLDQDVGDQGQALKKRMGALISPFQGG